MRLCYIGKAARKNAQICRHDKTRQRRIRHRSTIAGCGVNALSVLQLALLFRFFFCQQFIQLITAYMTEILPLHVVEDKLTNILAAVADTFD